MNFKTIKELQDYLSKYKQSQFAQTHGTDRFSKVKLFAKKLDNPQNKVKVVHVAGTSGKGSTCTIISRILEGQGKKVGLSISPHLIDVRERAQINNKNISKAEFLRCAGKLLPAISKMEKSGFTPSYFECFILLSYIIFNENKVDYAIMETGAGGRFDATNVADNSSKTCVLTKIGIDHVALLGNTISEIAANKADIIHEGNLVLSVDQKKQAIESISQRVKKTKTKLNLIKKDINFKNIRAKNHGYFFDFSYKNHDYKDLQINLDGDFQIENTSIALATCIEISFRDGFKINEKKLRETLENISFLGRFDTKKINDKYVVIDGAHNSQKMSAFISSLKKKYPDQKFDFLVGFKYGKTYSKILKYITPLADKIYATEFKFTDQSEILSAVSAKDIRKVLLNKLDFKNVETFENSNEALQKAINSNSKNILVITGSLYLLGEIYKEIQK